MTSGAALACFTSLLGVLTYLNHAHATQAQQHLLKLQAQQSELTQMLANERLAAVLERRSVHADDVIGKASAVWQEGARVVLSATSETLKLVVSHKVQASDQNPDQNPKALARALSIPSPHGCSRQQPSITPQISELYLTYECQTFDPDLQRISAPAR